MGNFAMLLNHFKTLFRNHEAVGFSVHGNQVKVLQEPSKFYETLIEKCQTVEKRIVLASLYLGTGNLESRLVKVIQNRVSEKPGLSVHVLLDCMRGSRGKTNSRSMLLPLIQSHPNAVKVSLYHTPKYRGILKKLIPNRYNEIIGLQHMKLYLFDNDLIITGANLSGDYFTDRQDRYIVVNSCKPLADFVEGLCQKVSEFSFQVDVNDQLKVQEKHPVDSDFNEFVEFARNRVQGFYRRTFEETRETDTDTTIYPMLEMGQFGIHQDSWTTQALLKSSPKDALVHLATGYFNMTKNYADSIINYSKAAYCLLMAHPTANGFYKAKGPAGGIPKGYSEIAGRFFDRLEEHNVQRVRMYEFVKPGWTFHSKGLWLAPDLKSPPVLTLIGSPNFGASHRNMKIVFVVNESVGHVLSPKNYSSGYVKSLLKQMRLTEKITAGERSVSHDLECQFAITTRNAELQEALKRERDDLYKFGVVYGAEERQRRPPLWVRLVLFLFRSYF